MKLGNRSRYPSKEELELWAHVTRDDQPLARKPPDKAKDELSLLSKPASLDKVEVSIRREPSESDEGHRPKRKPTIQPAPVPFNSQTVKRIARGRQEISARLDLHGLRQKDAYAALRRFLERCQVAGHKHVLIITGKGGADASPGQNFWEGEERGVLRRLVPQWLAEPAFHLQVVSFTEAALKHGGGGALYVTIRRSSRPRKRGFGAPGPQQRA